jgi:hypothetical protein
VELSLDRRDDGKFESSLEQDLRGSWYATLEPQDGTWMLRRRLLLDEALGAAIGSEG